MSKYYVLSNKDNVAVALENIPKNTKIKFDDKLIIFNENIQKGHKFALKNIKKNEIIVKYGCPIGRAKENIYIGEWVHVHNVKTTLKSGLKYKYDPVQNPILPKMEENRSFMGYKRKNGKVGIRNDLFIIPSVGCINALLDIVVSQFKENHPDNGSFDNVIVLKHPYGCSQLGDDFEQTRKILIDAALHPNAGGVLFFGLGCENNQISNIKKIILKQDNIDKSRIKFLIAQEVSNEFESALQLLEELNTIAADDKRTRQPISSLKIGLKCGGSDGLSGITANPLLGKFADYLVAQGGSVVLSEVPEMFGAEQQLMNRSIDVEVFDKTVKLINDFKKYFQSYGQPIYENPSPGNKEGGITTLEDKSLGCTQKSGTSLVVDVLNYGEKIKKPGLSLLQSPGNDLVASSAEAAADCQIILFTTGRGTPFAPFVPTIKISSNTELFQKKPWWIDFDAGKLLNNSMDQMSKEFINLVLQTASGEQTKNEKFNIHGLAIFKNGVTE